MATLVDFASLVRKKTYELTDLEYKEYLRVGNHVYVLAKTINLTDLLKDLDSTSAGSPILHLHLYCHRLQGSVADNGAFEMRIHGRGLSLKTLQIFAAVLQPWNRLDIVANKQSSVQVELYYDIAANAESMWLNLGNDLGSAFHVVRSSGSCLDQVTSKCTATQHIDLAAQETVGIRLKIDGPNGVVREVVPLTSVCSEELRELRASEFEAFGADARRLQNLPRLLEGLFTETSVELMDLKPQISTIIARLRFIRSCARNASNFVGLVKQTDVLLSRLQFPVGYPPTSNPDDWFYVPEQTPAALSTGMEGHMTVLLEQSRRLESRSDTQSLRELIRKTSIPIMDSIVASIGSTSTPERQDSAADQAASSRLSAVAKMGDLRGYRDELENAKEKFSQGIDEYKKRMQKKFWLNLIKGLIEIGVSVGMAVYSGGAGAPLTVGKVNEVLKGTSETIEQSSRLWMAIKALVSVALKVYPKLDAAFKENSNYKKVGNGSKGALTSELKETASGITDATIGGVVGQPIDYLGLLAEWREMDVCADVAFETIKDEVCAGGESIAGMDEYRVATKKLVIRGETVVNAMRDAYEARREYMLLVADQKARNSAIAEIKMLSSKVGTAQRAEDLAFIVWKQRILSEISQKKKEMFNRLHAGVLALVYQSNNVKLQNQSFATLSPVMSTEALTNQWAAFKSFTVEYKDPQTKTLEVNAQEAFPRGWRELLQKDSETPFQIPVTLSKLTRRHRMRIKTISAEFVGLKRKDGTSDRIKELEYTFWLGPLMFDRASPWEDARSPDATTVQYYMPRRMLVKQGKENNFVNENNNFAMRSLCCMGKISFERETLAEGWDLSTITDIQLRILYETLSFEQ